MAENKTAALRELLQALAVKHDFPIEEGRVQGLADFVELFLEWNARINIGGARTEVALVDEHLVDAVVAASLVPKTGRFVDVGSGGGLPAIPLALMLPGVAIDLFEPIAKKVAFLRTAVRALDLGDRVRVFDERIDEDAPRSGVAGAPGMYEVALSRATMAPDQWLALGSSLVVPGGRVVLFERRGAVLGRSAEVVKTYGDRQLSIHRTDATPAPG